MQVPSTDGFVHIRLNLDLGDGLEAVKAQLEQIPNARIADPADYELTTLRDFPQTLLAVDQHQAEMDWEKGYLEQELLEEHPYDLRITSAHNHPRKPAVQGLCGFPRETIAKAAVAKMLMALGRSGAEGDIEICVEPMVELAAAGEPPPTQCHSGPIGSRRATLTPRPMISITTARKSSFEIIRIDQDTSRLS